MQEIICLHEWQSWHPFKWNKARDGTNLFLTSPKTRYCWICKTWQMRKWFIWHTINIDPLFLVEMVVRFQSDIPPIPSPSYHPFPERHANEYAGFESRTP